MRFFDMFAQKAKGFGKKINTIQDDFEKSRERRIHERYKLEKKRATLRKVEMKTKRLSEMYKPKSKPQPDFFGSNMITGLKTGPVFMDNQRARKNCEKIIRPEHRRKRK